MLENFKLALPVFIEWFVWIGIYGAVAFVTSFFSVILCYQLYKNHNKLVKKTIKYCKKSW